MISKSKKSKKKKEYNNRIAKRLFRKGFNIFINEKEHYHFIPFIKSGSMSREATISFTYSVYKNCLEKINIKTYNKEVIETDSVLNAVEEVKNILKDNGKILVRASGTEPLVRVTISCEKQEDLDMYMTKIVNTINLAMEVK